MPIAIYVLLRPVVGLGHELSVWAVAALLHAAVATGVWQPLIGWLGLDPIYTGAAIRAAGGVDIAGLAVGGPIGSALHALLPSLILGPEHVAANAGISIVAAQGAPALGRGLAGFGGDVLWLIGGLLLVRRWSGRHPRVALVGLLIQGQIVVNHLFDARLSITDLDASGLPFALAVAAPASGGWFSQGLLQLSEPMRTLLIGSTLVVLAYACAAIVLFTSRQAWRPIRARRPHVPGVEGPHTRQLLLAGVVLAVVTAVSPIGALAFGTPNWTGAASTPGVGSMSLDPHAIGPLGDILRASPRAGPTHVELDRLGDGTWQYMVSGQPQVIRGVGYNPQYAGLDPAERTRLYERDFAAMHELGINTIEGWFEPQFDQITLDSAARNAYDRSTSTESGCSAGGARRTGSRRTSRQMGCGQLLS